MTEPEPFESRLARLEAAVKRLESGDAPLDQALAAYEEAVAHLKACHEMLQTAERRVKILVPDGRGGLEERDFDAPEE